MNVQYIHWPAKAAWSVVTREALGGRTLPDCLLLAHIGLSGEREAAASRSDMRNFVAHFDTAAAAPSKSGSGRFYGGRRKGYGKTESGLREK